MSKNLIARSVVAAAALLSGVARGGDREEPPGGVTYRVKHHDSLGGTSSGGNSINDRGWVAGFSTLPEDREVHAALWRGDDVVDLGTLGGPSSLVPWPVKNVRGLVVGISTTDQDDPLGEAWSCAAFMPTAGKTCLGFAWKDGVMRALPTLGGNNGFATGANNRGHIVGWAEDTVLDPSCQGSQRLGFHAVVWGPGETELRQLPEHAGDSASAATAINDAGQVVGISGACGVAVGSVSAAHAVLWEHGEVEDLGNIGGATWNTPMAINRHGTVVGFALDGDGELHAFIWTRQGGMRDLGTLEPTHSFSQALGVNDRGQVVGWSCGATCSAFLYEGGVMTNLNDLVEPGYLGHLVYANDIDEAGEITGGASDPTTGTSPAFVAIPHVEP